MRILTIALLAGAVIAARSDEAVATGGIRQTHVNGHGQAVSSEPQPATPDKSNMRYYGGPKSPMWRG
jgi:hypothetical protein